MNNKNTISTTPQSGVEKKSTNKSSTSEKKLVQARLPFKVLSSSTEIAGTLSESRKRKLSYSPEALKSTPKQTKLLKPKLKENLDCTEPQLIELSDDESSTDLDNDNKTNIDEKVDLIVHNDSQSQTKTSNKLTIKLPLSGKKKRKKCKSKLEDSGSSDPEVSNNVDETEKRSQKQIVQNIKEKQINEDQKVQLIKESNNRIVNRENQTINETEEIFLLETSDEGEEEVKHTDNENETKSTKQKLGETRKLTYFMSPQPINEKKSTSQNTVINSIFCPISNLSPNLKKKDEIDRLENGRQKKRKMEDQKSKVTEEQRRKEKEESKRKEKEEKDELKRKEKEEKDELKRKEKEEKEELKRKEKEEKEKKRMAELEMKTVEKRQRDEEKRKKDEQKEDERRKRDDEKRKKDLEKEEAENKKRKAAEVFTKFFHQKKSNSKINDADQITEYSCELGHRAFMPFQVKGDMKLAPLIRKKLSVDSKKNLDAIISDQWQLSEQEHYLNLLKTGKHTAYKLEKTEKESTDDVIIISELNEVGRSIDEATKSKQSYKAKYFHFKENRRPPYYGTWMKKSTLIGPRRPFAYDKAYFEYDVDSDDEWEEEEPGESLHGSDDEKESEDEYEVDNEFFVPHGHLSDEEMQNEDEPEHDNTPECQKAKLKILQLEFVKEMKKKTEKIRPRIIGIVWADSNGNQPDNCPNPIWESLNKRAMIMQLSPPMIIAPDNRPLEAGSPTSKEKKQTKRNELTFELVVELIRLVHGNRNKKKFLIDEFKAFIAEKFKSEENSIEYSKAVLKDQIDKIAKWTILEDKESLNKKKKLCWMVSSETLSIYNMGNIPYINDWKYILPPRYTNEQEMSNNNKTVPQNNNSKGSTDIKIFTKTISKDETFSSGVKKENNKTVADVVKETCVKKRVPLLMSVPRGQPIPETYKNELINNFLKKEKEKESVNTKSLSEKTYID